VIVSAWQQHGGELWSALDSYVRWHARPASPAVDRAIVGILTLLMPADVPSLLREAVGAGGLCDSSGRALAAESQQQHLWSLLVSLQKIYQQQPPSGLDFANTWLAAVVYIVALVLLKQDLNVTELVPETTTSSSSSSLEQTVGLAEASCSAANAAAATMPVQAVVPWLALSGECLLIWAAKFRAALFVDEHLMLEVAALPTEVVQQLLEPSQGPVSDLGSSAGVRPDGVRDPDRVQAILAFWKANGTTLACFDKHVEMLLMCLGGCDSDSSSSSSRYTKLADAGYPAGKAVFALRVASILWGQLLPSVLSKSGPADGSEASQAARASAAADPVTLRWRCGLLVESVLGAAGYLRSFAFGWGCNDRQCSNLSGPSELLLVKGKAHLCSGCRTARYCSRECQTRHWPEHKPVCKALKAAAAAAAGGKHSAGRATAQ